MSLRDLFNNIKEVQNLNPIVLTADQLTTGVDHQGFKGVDHNILLGLSGDTLSGSVKIDLILEDSDDDSVYTPVIDNNCVLGATVDSSGLWATIDAPGEDERVYTIGYRGFKRFSRINMDFTGTHTNGIPAASLAVLGLPQQAAVVK